MNNEEKIKIGVDIEGNAIDVLGALKKELRAFEQNLKRLSGIGAAAVGRGTKSRGQDDAGSRITDQLAVDRIALRGLRERMSFQGRMTRQRLSEEGAAARAARRTANEAAKTEESRVRTAARNIRYLAGLHRRYQEQQRQERETLRASASDWGRSALRRTRDVGSQVRRSAERTAVGAAVVGGGAMRKIVRSEADVDASEVDARIYGGLSRDAARKLRNDWAAPLAEQLGSTTSRMLSGYTEAIKVGIPVEGAKAFSGLAVKTSEAWGLDISDVTDTLGTINQIITSTGKAFDFDNIKSVANTVQHLAAKQATTPGKLVEFMKRGAGAAQVLGMSQEAGLAFGSASTSLGNRAGTSGELFDYIASRVIELPKLVKRHGIEGQDARQLVAALGYGSADAMDRARRRDPDAFLPDLIERFSKIRDPKKRDQSIRSFAGREWMGEFGRMVTGHETYKDAVRLQREAKDFDAIEEAWALHTKKLTFIGKQLKAGFLNFLGEFGQTLTPFAEQIRDYFLSWSDKFRGGGIGDRFKAAIGGLIEGLGFKDLPDLLKGIFGEPGQGDAGGIQAWRETFRGFGAGIRDIADAVRQFFRALAGANAGPAELGRWAGRFVALGGALLTLSPIITIMTSLASGLLAVAAAVVSAWSTMKLAGLVGGATAGARAGAIAGGAAAGGAALPFVGGALTTAAIAKWFTDYLPDFGKRGADGIRDDQSKGLMGSLWQWMTRRDNRPEPASKALSDLPPEIQRLNEEIDLLREQLDSNAKVQKQSFDVSPSLRSMIQTASLSNISDRMGGLVQKASLSKEQKMAGLVESFNQQEQQRRNRASGSFSTGTSTGGLLGNQTPGSQLGNVGMGYRGIIGGSGKVPGGNAGATFAAKAPGIMKNLMSDFGLTKEQAAGVVANLGHESAGFTAYQEGKPLGGGRGGAGWAQWTGPRRRQFEAWAAAKGLDPRSDAANYGFLKHELQTTHAGSLAAVKRENSAQGAMVAFENNFERAGVKNWASRQGYLNRALSMGEGGSGGGTDMASAVKASASASAVDIAKSFEGMNENRDYGKLRSFMGTEIRGAQNAWCADFVNSSLKAVGLRGTGSRIANSFLGWGQGVDAKDALKGDVLVEHRGKGVNGQGGHAGLATGNKRTNPRTGELEIEMISGNYSNSVATSWERASRLAVRRANETGAMAKEALTPKVDEMTSTGWKAGAGGNARAIEGANKVPLPSARMDPESATRNVPLNAINSGDIGRRADAGTPGGSSGGGAPITINVNGAGQDPESVANAVHRRLSDRIGRRTHEVEHHWG